MQRMNTILSGLAFCFINTEHYFCHQVRRNKKKHVEMLTLALSLKECCKCTLIKEKKLYYFLFEFIMFSFPVFECKNRNGRRDIERSFRRSALSPHFAASNNISDNVVHTFAQPSWAGRFQGNIVVSGFFKNKF